MFFLTVFFFLEMDRKKILRPFFLGKHLHLCPWSLASSITGTVLGLRFFFVFLALASSLVSSTPPLISSSQNLSKGKIFFRVDALFFFFCRTGTGKKKLHHKPISGRVDRASATETVDSDSIPGRVKPKTIKIGMHSFPA